MHLEGGVGEASFQLVGYSRRPNSDCCGKSFQPPPNQQNKITFLNYGGSLSKKGILGTSEIKRAVVTYKLSVKVAKRTLYVIAKGKKLLFPNLLTIDRSPFDLPSDSSTNQRKSIKDKAMNMLNMELESYFDSALGVFVMNRTTLPSTECQQFRSIADISEASLFKSKLGDFSILRYTRENQTVAVTLDDQVTSCGQVMYRTGIPNIEVLLLKEKEKFLRAEHLKTKDIFEEVLLETEVRGALNSIELSLDHLYQSLNQRACEMARKDIMMTSALLRANLETLYDNEGLPLFSHIAGESITLFKCKPVEVQIRHNKNDVAQRSLSG